MATYDHARVPRIVIGPGVLEKLPGLLTDREATGVVLVSDHGVEQAGHVARVSALLEEVAQVDTHIAPSGEPLADNVEAAAALVRERPGATVIGLGGGTAMDIAKLAAAAAASGEPVDHYFLRPDSFAGKRPSILIPTTAGTGSEVTRTAVCTSGAGHKLWCWGEKLLPELVLLDPTLTYSLPATLTAAAGIDAVAHAVEAVTGRRRNAFATAPGLHAIQLAARHLPMAAIAPGHAATRQSMQEAACLAGLARENGGTGVAHTLAHALGAAYGIPHGVAVGAALRAVLPWNIIGDQELYDPVAAAFDPAARAADLPRLYDDLLAAAGFDAALEPYRQTRVDAGVLDEVCNLPEHAPTLRNNARVANAVDVKSLCITLECAWNAAAA